MVQINLTALVQERPRKKNVQYLVVPRDALIVLPSTVTLLIAWIARIASSDR